MHRKSLIIATLVLTCAVCGCKKQQQPTLEAVRLTTEQLINPVGIDFKEPRLGWQIVSNQQDVVQQSYHILAASAPEKLEAGEGDLWDSGEVASDQSVYVPYGGPALTSGQKVYWKVQVTTNKGQTAWSEPASFQMGLMDASEWQASWIGGDFDDDVLVGRTRVAARYLRKEFSVDKQVQQANLYICGLGVYKLYMNNDIVSQFQELAPTPTGYDTIALYNTYDVTEMVRQGNNAIGVALGAGRYVSPRIAGDPTISIPEMTHYGLPKLLLQLELVYGDGSKQLVLSDDSWQITNRGPIRLNNEFDGEIYDARMELGDWYAAGYAADSIWRPATVQPKPCRRIGAQNNPNITLMEVLQPVAVTEPEEGMYILDMGQNMVGWLKVQVHGEPGDSIKFRFAETLKDDGHIYTDNLRSALCTDVYIPKDKETALWNPLFVYHGFRYVEVTGLRYKPAKTDFEGQVLYDEMETIGTFQTSNEMLNKLHKNAYWGIRGNYRGMPTDCPQRDERLGWTGDRAVGSLGESYIFDNHALYAKWLNDIQNEQGAAGNLTANLYPVYCKVMADNMTWLSAYPLTAKMLYEQFGDIRPIRDHYDSMKKWMNFMRDNYMKEGVMVADKYGDWCSPPERPELVHAKDPSRKTEGVVLGSTCYYMLAYLMADFAKLLDKPDDAAAFVKEAEDLKKAFNDLCFRYEEGFYSNNTVAANILPLRYGMVPEGREQEVFDHVIQKTMDDFNGHVSSGVLGMQQLMRGLTDYGRGDLALSMATTTEYPGWGYMIANGATTIWELWNGNTANPSMNSGNHVMLLGDVIIWMYNYLAGIGNAPGSAGYKVVQLKPRLIDGLDRVEATYRTVYGQVASSLKRSGKRLSWAFEIPCNTTGRICVPLQGGELKDDAKKSIEEEGGKYVGIEDGYAVFTFPSGIYKIVTK